MNQIHPTKGNGLGFFSEAISQSIYIQLKSHRKPTVRLLTDSVLSLRNGGLGAGLSTPRHAPSVPHDIIRFFPKTKDRIFDVCAPLYEAGCSLREIEEKTGFAKSSIRETLTRRGLTLRNASKAKPVKSKVPVKMRSPVIPFGYAWLEGKMVKEPREYKIVLKIERLWQSGKSLTAIARDLNDQRVPTRNGKKWFHCTVGAIIKRQKNESK